MHWKETQRKSEYLVPDDVVDVSFRIDCQQLPIDHAYALAEATIEIAPWLKTEEAGIHTIYGAASSNGWNRPVECSGSIIHLSRRTRLNLRIPKHRLAEAHKLCNLSLEVDGHKLMLGECLLKPLVPTKSIFCRAVAGENVDDEDAFTETVLTQLKALQIDVRKLLCGLSHTIGTPNGVIKTRSLMLADLTFAHSIRLQQVGLGNHRLLGCGLFLAHKGIDAVNAKDENH